MNPTRLVLALILAALPVLAAGPLTGEAAPVAAARYEVVNVYPHDRQAWTQGLAFSRGVLHESTGLYGRSSVRRVDLASGRVLRQRRLPDHIFAEGLAFVDGRAFLLTWREERALVLHPRTFARLGRFTYRGEGWGLTTDGRRLVMSDGSSTITFRHPDTFAVLRSINVTHKGTPVTRLNELEWINGLIWANVWLEPVIVVIDPGSGRVVQRIDFGALLERERRLGEPSEMNGIAYLASAGRIFVTGKRWRNLYEIRLAGG